VGAAEGDPWALEAVCPCFRFYNFPALRPAEKRAGSYAFKEDEHRFYFESRIVLVRDFREILFP